MKIGLCAVACMVFMFSCGSNREPRRSDTAMKGREVRATGIQAPAQLWEGSCTGFPMGSITNYNHTVQLAEVKEGGVRVRKTPIWSGTDKSNVIGKVKSGMLLPAWGPVKNRPSQGIGFVVPLKDSAGKTCRGYVSQTVIRRVKCDAFKTRKLFKAFPQALDTIPGPCMDR